VSQIEFFAARMLLSELLLVERFDFLVGDLNARTNHGVHDLAAFDLALDLRAIFLDLEPVTHDAAQQLFDGNTVVLGDRRNCRIDFVAICAEFEPLDHRAEELRFDQSFEGIFAD